MSQNIILHLIFFNYVKNIKSILSLDVQKQMEGQIWPGGCSLPTNALAQRVCSNGGFTCCYKLNEMEREKKLYRVRLGMTLSSSSSNHTS